MLCTPVAAQQEVIMKERELVFTVCQALCWGLGASGGVRRRGGSTPSKMVFKTSHMQKESIHIRGQLLNMPCMVEWVECIFWEEVELCISGLPVLLDL